MSQTQKGSLLYILLLFGFNCFSQSNYERGYFIDSKNSRKEVWINNKDWRNNPTDFQYKEKENGLEKDKSIEAIQEFGIEGKIKYIRFEVEIDQSSNYLGTLSNERKPQYKKDTVFLEELLNGKASLYRFRNKDFIRYFYALDNAPPEQLIYKKFRIEKSGSIAYNLDFQLQLKENLGCNSISKNLRKLDYEKKDLLSYFIEYNSCHDSDFQVNDRRLGNEDKLVKFYLKGGLRHSSLLIDHLPTDTRDIDFGNQLGFRIGLEVEYTMPFLNDRWAFIAEANYNTFNSSKEITYIQTAAIQRTTLVTINYKGIDFPLGIRHYFPLNEQSKLFVNINHTMHLGLGDDIVAERRSVVDLVIGKRLVTDQNIALGLGYRYNDRFYVEAKYETNRNFLNYFNWRSDYRNISLAVGWNFL
ncbi:MAG: outer membrane beta-barrel protein [Bacteroidota bacterium]